MNWPWLIGLKISCRGLSRLGLKAFSSGEAKSSKIIGPGQALQIEVEFCSGRISDSVREEVDERHIGEGSKVKQDLFEEGL